MCWTGCEDASDNEAEFWNRHCWRTTVLSVTDRDRHCVVHVLCISCLQCGVWNELSEAILLTMDGSWGRNDQLSFRMRPWQVDRAPVGGHICNYVGNQIRLGTLEIKRRNKVKRGFRAQAGRSEGWE